MTRLEFMKRIAAGAALPALGGCASLCGCRKTKFKLAMAGYKFTTDDALSFCEVHGFKYLCVKNKHLPFEATPAEIAEFRRKCADHGVTPYGVGPIYMHGAEEAKRMFDYAAALGVPLIVGVPGVGTGKESRSDRAMCEVCSALADEYKIKYAIHNHSSDSPKMFPDGKYGSEALSRRPRHVRAHPRPVSAHRLLRRLGLHVRRRP